MPAPDHTSPLHAFSASLATLVAGAAPAVVAVRAHRVRASGFAWRPGLVVTADEALPDELPNEPGALTIVTADGTAHPATVAGRDPTTAIALLRLDRQDLPTIAAAPPAAPGALAAVLGAEDSAASVALGVVSLAGPAWRSLRGGEIDARLELDARPRRTAEGGLVLDADGGALGMTVFGPRRRVLVIPTSTIDRVAARLASHGRIARGYLGLGLQPVALADGGTGAMVMGVDPSGPGAAAGICQGDVITAWNGETLRGVGSLVRRLGPDTVGTTVPLTLRRGGAPLALSLTIGERPAA
jgi:S1-C subfamily serine protease